MTKYQLRRWIDFRKALPPLGVEVEVRAFKRWKPERIIFTHVDMSWGGTIPYQGIRQTPFGRHAFREFSSTLYKDDSRWRYTDARLPSAADLTRGRARLARLNRAKRLRAHREALRLRRAQQRAAAERARIEALPVFRIRRIACYSAGGSNYYHHADVKAATYREALRAAQEGRVQNWRSVDCFDSSDQPYMEFEYLYRLRDGSHHAAVPLKSIPADWGKKLRFEPLPFRRYLANGRVYGPRYP